MYNDYSACVFGIVSCVPVSLYCSLLFYPSACTYTSICIQLAFNENFNGAITKCIVKVFCDYEFSILSTP